MLSARGLYRQLSALFAECCVLRCFTLYLRYGLAGTAAHEVKAAFIRAVNKMSGDRKALMADLREVQQAFSGSEELESRLRELDERLNAEADEVQEMIATNARVAQNQDEYSTAYDAAVGRYESTKAERDSVAAEIRQKGIRRR